MDCQRLITVCLGVTFLPLLVYSRFLKDSLVLKGVQILKFALIAHFLNGGLKLCFLSFHFLIFSILKLYHCKKLTRFNQNSLYVLPGAYTLCVFYSTL